MPARHIALPAGSDDIEECFARGWTDGLPVAPPTPRRVEAMLAGTSEAPDTLLGTMPPQHGPCTVEKVAANATMAGCLPEHLPVVIAAVRAVLTPQFNVHGVLATTYFATPVVIVNGPITRTIGMNSGINVFGQGNRANATIGRALQLTIRNVGGGRPGEIDRATYGHPGKFTFCFCELEDSSPWESLAVERGYPADTSTVTVFAGEAPRAAIDEHSRTPDSLAASLALCLRAMGHPKKVQWLDAMLVIGPQHMGVLRHAGWSKQHLRARLIELCTIPIDELRAGVLGTDQTVAELDNYADEGGRVRKFDPSQLWLLHAGGEAGPTSAIIGGWLRGEMGGSAPVTVEIRP